MCGYCTETIQLNNLEREKQGKRIRELDYELIAGPYLQEAGDLLAAMKKIVAAAQRKKVDTQSIISSEVLICRAIDLLFDEGFFSPSYQNLLRSRTFRRAVTDACTPEKQAALDALPSQCRVINLSCLYQEEFYYYPACSQGLKKFKIFELVKHECLELLRAYVRDWVQAEGKMEYVEFTTMFRALYASISLLGRFRSSKRLLWTLVEETPGSPDLAGYTLWMQHRAILHLFRHEGFEKIVARMEHVRASLFWYLDLKIGLTAEQKKLLSYKVQTLARGDLVDNDFSLREWLVQ